MALRNFSKEKPSTKAAPEKPAGRFSGKRKPEPEPEPEEEEEPDEDEDEEDDEEEEEKPAARGKFGRSGNAARSASGGGGSGGGGARRGRDHRAVRGRYAGVPSAAPRPGQIEEGRYRVEIVKTWESKNPGTGTWFQITMKVLETSREDIKPGAMVSHRYSTKEDAQSVTGPKIVAFCRACVGFEEDSEMENALPNYGDLIDAAHGNKEAQQEPNPMNDDEPFGENPLEGCIVELHCSLGERKPNKKGVMTQYYEIEWYPELEE